MRTVSPTSRRGVRGSRCAALAILLACLAACGGSPSGEPVWEGAAEPQSTSGLAGLWRLNAAGEPDGTSLSLGGAGLTILRPCVTVFGTWAARGGLFLGDIDNNANASAVNAGCTDTAPADLPGWLASAVGYEAAEDGWRLVDARGTEVASLRPGGTVPPSAPRSHVVVQRDGDGTSPADRARLNAMPAAPLPPEVIPATAATLVGRWGPPVPTGFTCDHPYLSFRADGTWRGHSDSSPLGGRWVIGAEGLALGTADADDGPSCVRYVGSPAVDTAVESWMRLLARAGFRDGQLILFNADGGELAQLDRRPEPAAGDDVDGDGLSDTSGDSSVQRTAAPQPPPDPRRTGIAVPGGVRYLASTSEHLIGLTPFGTSAKYERSWAPNQVLGVDHTRRGAMIITGCAAGDISLTVHAPGAPPPALATVMRGWEVAEEETMTIDGALRAYDILGSWGADVFTPTTPGLHRVRVLARGRNVNYDGTCKAGDESYDITIWPVNETHPRVRLGDDGVR